MSVQVSADAGALAFIVLFALCLAASFTLAWRALRRRPWRGPARLLAGALASYAALLCGSGLAARRDVRLPPGEEKCFDDWCATAAAARFAEAPGGLRPQGRLLIVEVLVHNQAQRVAMSGDRPRVALLDDRGRLYLPLAGAAGALGLGGAPLAVRLAPGESARAPAVFDVPPEASGFSLLVSEGPPFLAWVPGEERAPFHGRVLIALP